MWDYVWTWDFWRPLFTAFVGGGAASTILSVWFKNRVKNEYKLKQIKLENELEGKLEGIKTGYQKVLDENQVRFSRLHADRADVIKELYRRLIKAEEEVGAAVSPMQPSSDEAQKKQKQAAKQAFDEFSHYFTENRIFLTPQDCELLESLHQTAKNAWVDYTTYDWVRMEEMEAKDKIDKRQLQFKAYKTMVDEFKKRRLRLEQEFRLALGLMSATPDVQQRGAANA